MKIEGFHLELTNICTLKCPGCARTNFIDRFPAKWKNYSINLQDLKNFLDIDISGINFLLCGVYGDPIYHPQFFEVCEWLKVNNANIQVTTNGSYRNEEWWKKLASILDKNDNITWSIDGLPDNFTEYRINGDWNSIETGIKTITRTNIKTSWKYIVFKYNQYDIDDAKKLSQDLNIDNFKIHYSDRWNNDTDHYKPDELFISQTYKNKIDYKNNIVSKNIDAKCLKNNSEHFISASGHYVPCCYIADHRFYFKTQWGKNKNSYAITENTISSLLQKKDVTDFYQGLSTDNFPTACSFNCAGGTE
jgi:MoaA/NifB/PqqE/SkfB family radical SAM enzyme